MGAANRSSKTMFTGLIVFILSYSLLNFFAKAFLATGTAMITAFGLSAVIFGVFIAWRNDHFNKFFR